MDLCSLSFSSNTSLSYFSSKVFPSVHKNQWSQYISYDTEKNKSFTYGPRNFSTIRISNFRCSSSKNNDNSSTSGSSDQSAPKDDIDIKNSPFESSTNEDASTQKSPAESLDWRTVRAKLVASEQAQVSNITSSCASESTIGSKWAHPIPIPESGCVLVATEKLDGVQPFARSVVLLLRSGTRDPREGPFGLIINKPLHKKVKDMNPSNMYLATTLSECSLHLGGPLNASMFLLNTGKKSPPSSFVQVIPGLCCGASNSLDEASEMVKKGVLDPEDIKFFVGYAGWEFDQLNQEIEMGFWNVAACNSDLINDKSQLSSSGLWEEILHLMANYTKK